MSDANHNHEPVELAHGAFSIREVSILLAKELSSRQGVRLPFKYSVGMNWGPNNESVVVTIKDGHR